MPTARMLLCPVVLFIMAFASGCERGKSVPGGAQDTAVSSDSKTADTKTSNSTPDIEEWAVYEDEFIRILHPKDRPAFGPREAVNKSPTRGYIIMGPKDIPGIPSADAIVVSEQAPLSGTLRESAQEHMKYAAKEDARLLGRFQDVAPVGGRCISFVKEGYTGECITPDGVKKPVCFMITLGAECQTNSGIHYMVHSGGGGYPDRGKLNANAQDQIRIFNRFLKSIEFKK